MEAQQEHEPTEQVVLGVAGVEPEPGRRGQGERADARCPAGGAAAAGQQLHAADRDHAAHEAEQVDLEGDAPERDQQREDVTDDDVARIARSMQDAQRLDTGHRFRRIAKPGMAGQDGGEQDPAEDGGTGRPRVIGPGERQQGERAGLAVWPSAEHGRDATSEPRLYRRAPAGPLAPSRRPFGRPRASVLWRAPLLGRRWRTTCGNARGMTTALCLRPPAAHAVPSGVISA